MLKSFLLSLALICGAASAGTVAQYLKDGIPASATSITPTKGVMQVANGTAFISVTVGANTTVLTADSSTLSGVAWTAPAAGLTGTTQSGTPFLTVLGSSGFNSATGVRNTGVGYQAGNAVTIGTDNAFFGYQSGLLNTASENTFFGSSSGASNVGGVRNTFLGFQAGTLNTGSDNTAIGWKSGDAITSGTDNTFVGVNSGGGNQSGQSNVAVGQNAYLSGTGSQNVIVGSTSGNDGANSATGNTIVGYNSGSAITTATGLTFIGFQAGKSATGVNNTAVGYGAGDSFTTGVGNSFFGTNAGGAAGATGISECSFFGNSAGAAVTGDNNSIFGSNAGDAFTTGAGNSIFGTNAGGAAGATSMSNCAFFGLQTGLLNTADGNTFIGAACGSVNTSGTGQTFVGFRAGANVTGVDNSIFGADAGDVISTGARNSIFGRNAGGGAGSTGMDDTTLIGFNAGLLNTGDGNVFIGSEAGDANTSNTYLTYVGAGAGGLATGANNVLVGAAAGASITTGNGNTFIGRQADTASSGVTNSIAIGYLTTVQGNNQFVAGSATANIANVFFGEGVTDSSAISYTINGTGGSGTDNAGADVLIAGGKGTGAGSSGYSGFKYPLLAATGTTLQTLSTLVNRPFGMIYVSTADVTLTGSTATTGTIIGAQTNAVPQGTLTLDAQLLRVGTTIRVKAYGRMTQSAAGPTLTVEGRLGSTVISTATIAASAGGITDGAVNFETTLVCRSTGATGTVQGDGRVDAQLATATGTNVYFSMYKAVTTVDTTGALAIDLFATWSANTAGNAITITNVTVEFR